MEVPFYFKSIVDSMNIDIAAVGGTAYSVAGAMILACMMDPLKRYDFTHANKRTFRWCN